MINHWSAHQTSSSSSRQNRLIIFVCWTRGIYLRCVYSYLSHQNHKSHAKYLQRTTVIWMYNKLFNDLRFWSIVAVAVCGYTIFTTIEHTMNDSGSRNVIPTCENIYTSNFSTIYMSFTANLLKKKLGYCMIIHPHHRVEKLQFEK